MRLTFIFFFLAVGSWAQGANSWVKKNDFAGLKREQAVGVAFGDYGYAGTGVDTTETVLNDWWKYNPTTDSWTQMASLPGTPRRSAFAFVTNTMIYVGGGLSADEAVFGTLIADMWEYSPATNAWMPKASIPANMSSGVYYASAFTLDGKGYVVGGKFGPNAYSNQLWEYKPSEDMWTQRANFPGGVRYNLASVSVGNRGFVGLGTNQDIYCNDWWEYSPATNQWIQKADFAGGHRGGASTFSIHNRGYVCLGTNGGMKQDLYVYVPELDVWYPRANYGGSERKQAFAFAIHDRAYVGTGSGPGGKKQSMYEYISEYELGVQEDEIEVSTYPNPVVNQLQITSEELIQSYDLVTSGGAILQHNEVKGNHFSIDRGMAEAGIYWLILRSESGKVSTSKIIFQ